MFDPLCRVKRFLFEQIWRPDLARLPLVRRAPYRALRMGYVLVRDVFTGQLTLHAMSLVYTTLLSLVPLLAVSFSVLKAFGVHNQIEPLLAQLLAPLGQKAPEITDRVLLFVENMKVGVLGSVGLALLIYTVVSLIQKIEDAFNYVWNVKRTRSFARRFSDYLSVLLIGPVLVFSAMGMTASIMNTDLVQRIIAYEPFGSAVVVAGAMLPYLFIIAAFTFIYLFVPNTKVHFSAGIVGALVGGVLWQSIGMGFASFAAGSTKYDAIYSSFAILILFMIWLYLSWLVLLLGAQVAYYHQNPRQVRRDATPFRFTNRSREHDGLLVLYLVARDYEAGRLHWTLERVVQELALPGEAAAELLDQLQALGLLVTTGDDPPAYLPARDPAALRLRDVLALLRGRGEPHERPAGERAAAVEEVLRRAEGSVERTLGDMTLRDLARDRAPAGLSNG